MLLRFGVQNHRSIREYQQLLLTAAPFKELDDILFMSGDERTKVVPTVAIYGANAAGKSTLLHALQFMKATVISSHSSGKASGGTPHFPFLLDDDSRNGPSRYDIDFEIEEIRYHYGFKLDGKKINEEWLYATPLNKSRRTRQTWFHRLDSETEIYFGKELKGENKLIEKVVRENSLFLSAAAQNAHPQLSKIYQYFDKKVFGDFNGNANFNAAVNVANFFKSHQEYEKNAIDFLRIGDTGISGISYKDFVADKYKPFFNDLSEIIKRHAGVDAPADDIFKETRLATLRHKGAEGKEFALEMDAESAGTKALLSAIGPILLALETGGVLLIDELSNSLHPLMSRKIVSLFSDAKLNKGRAQLIFSTHDTNLLCDGLFRRDQIWFAEKDREGSTHVFPLSDIDVDKRANLENGYLQGRFGAIPFFNAIDEAWYSSEEVITGEAEV